MVERHRLDDSEGTGHVCWIKADLKVPSEAVAGAEKVRRKRAWICHVDTSRPWIYAVCQPGAHVVPFLSVCGVSSKANDVHGKGS